MQSMCPAAPAASPARRRAAPPPPCAGAPRQSPSRASSLDSTRRACGNRPGPGGTAVSCFFQSAARTARSSVRSSSSRICASAARSKNASSRSCRGRGRSASSRSIRSRRGRSPQSHGSPGSSGSAVSRSRKDSGAVEPSSRSQAAGQEAQRLTSRKGPYSSMNRGWVRQVRDVASAPNIRWISTHSPGSERGTGRPGGGSRNPPPRPLWSASRSRSPREPGVS